MFIPPYSVLELNSPRGLTDLHHYLMVSLKQTICVVLTNAMKLNPLLEMTSLL
jgi:hypothetical protein